MMQMFFQFSDKVTLLFEFWQTHGPGGLVGSLLILIVAAIGYEALKVARWCIEAGETAPSGGCGPSGSEPRPESDGQSAQVSQGGCDSMQACCPGATANGSDAEALRFLKPIASAQRRPIKRQLLLTLLHIVQVTLGYLLMLTAMTYNAWVFLAIVLGAGLGYLLAFPFLPASLLVPSASPSPSPSLRGATAEAEAAASPDRRDQRSSPASEFAPTMATLLEEPQLPSRHSEA
ncbi:protein SLC31A2 [Petromyzon marinus]|uniref:protein SLC31A2 n=1 Tax=Petromyzon marinus TaxID=7757 RepID=UPI003F71642B